MQLESSVEPANSDEWREPSSGPLVSICIPTYNGEHWIRESIASALEQTYQPIEVLIVDDGSTDNTVEIVSSLKDKSVRVIRNQSNQGLAGNWNECVRLAKGEFIKFLFQDDVLYPECTAKMMKLATAHPELGLIFTRRDLSVESDAPADLAREIPADYSDPHLRFVHLSETKPHANAFDALGATLNGRHLFAQHLDKGLYQSCIAEPPSTLIRKDVFRRLGLFNTRMHQACDIEMWLRVLFFFDVGFVDEKLLIFRIHGKSATASNRATRRAEYDRFWMLEGLLNHPEIERAHPEIIAWREDLLNRYRNSLVRPTAGWRSLSGTGGWREAVSDAREMPRRIKFLKEASAFLKDRPPIHPRLESV